MDDQGNVYIAAGQVFVYNSSGELSIPLRFQNDPRNCCSGAAMGTLCLFLRVVPCMPWRLVLERAENRGILNLPAATGILRISHRRFCAVLVDLLASLFSPASFSHSQSDGAAP